MHSSIVLTFSHENNRRFQEAIRLVFENDENVSYQSAPVKTYDRCIIKSNTDYSSTFYPTSACILDLLRCSITFNNTQSFINGLKKFENLINNGEIECIQNILRIKNGFSNILNWKSFNDSEYCDIKLNVLYVNQYKTVKQIVEVCNACLTNFLW